MKSELLESHDELRAVLRLASIELTKRIGRKDTPLLQLMQRTLQSAQVIAKAESSKSKNAAAA